MKEFLNYINTMRYLQKANLSVKNIVISIIYALGLGLALLSVTSGTIAFIAGIMGFASAFPVFWVRRLKPNINAMLPITPKKRTAFELLSVPVLFVLFLVFVIAIMFIANLFAMLLVLFATGDSEFLFKATLEVFAENFTYAFCNVYSTLILIFGAAYIMGASMIYSHIDRFKYRIFTAVGMFVYAAVGAQLILQLSQRSYYSGSEVIPVYSPFGQAGVFMAGGRFAWLAILMVAISGCASIAMGVYLTIKKNVPQKY